MTEQARVGLLVLISAAILVFTVFYMTSVGLRGQYVEYKTYLKFVGGLDAGAPVRYGGLQVGRIRRLGVSPSDPTRIEISLAVKRDTPVRADSRATLSQLGFIGENYLEIQPGSSPTPLPPGSVIPSEETQDMAALMRKANALMEQARPLVADLHKNLNQVSAQVETLLANLQQVTGPANRAHLNGILRETDQMIARTSPKIDNITTNLQNASGKIDPLMADLRATEAKVDKLIAELNSVMAENRKDLRTSIEQLAKTLETTRELVTQLNAAVNDNSANVDAILLSIRASSENLRQFTDTLKQRPFSLLRVVPTPDRRVPALAGSTKRAEAAARGDK